MKDKLLILATLTGLLIGALWLALPTTAHAQCGGNPSEPPCPPAAEREKKATATDRPVTPTPTLTQTPRPTPTGTATPLPVVAVDAEPSAAQRRLPPALGITSQQNSILLLLLLAAILGLVINRLRGRKPTSHHRNILFFPVQPEVQKAGKPGMAHPPEPVAPALPKLTEIAIHGQSRADQDVLGKNSGPIGPAGTPGMANPPDGDVPVEDAPET